MNIYSLLSFIVFIIYFGLGLYVLGHNWRSNVNRSFFFFAISIAIWSYAYIFLFIATDEDSVIYWDRIGSIGWCIFPSLILSFHITLTDSLKKIKYYVIAAYHTLGIIFIYISFSGALLTKEWYHDGSAWIPLKENTTSLWYWIFNLYLVSSVLFCIIMIYKWRKKEQSKRVKIQSIILFTTLTITIIGGYTTNFISPLFKIAALPNIAHIVSLLWIVGIAYCIMKYRFMVLSPKAAANEIIKEMKELLFFVDNSSNIVQINRYTEKMTGFLNHEIEGKSIIDLFIEKEVVREFILQNKPKKDQKDIELQMIAHSGILIPVIVSVSAIKDNIGEILGNVIVGRDIRQKKQLEKEIKDRITAQEELKKAHDELENKVKQRTIDLLNSNDALQKEIFDHKNAKADLLIAKEKAEESDKLKTAFLANMSHEIRTPLNGMLGFTDLLKDETLSLQERTEFLTIIKNCGYHLLDLINDIIDISKIEVGQLTLKYSHINLNTFLNNILVSFEPIVKMQLNKNISIELICDKEKENMSIISDELRLKQIFVNLIGNAIKFTEKGIISFGYSVNEKDQLTYFVKDSGVGIQHDKLSKIFERFTQIENTATKKYRGTGLGLTITRELIELMEGKIWVESEEGKGTSFFFTFEKELFN